MVYVSLVATIVVAIYTLYSGYFMSGSYLLIRIGSTTIAYLLPATLWHAQVALWWVPAIALGCAVLGPLGAIPGLALMSITLWGALQGTSVLWALLCLYIALTACHSYMLYRWPRSVDDTILLVCLGGGMMSLICGLIWNWDITAWCNLICQVAIGFVLRYRPELIEDSIEP